MFFVDFCYGVSLSNFCMDFMFYHPLLMSNRFVPYYDRKCVSIVATASCPYKETGVFDSNIS